MELIDQQSPFAWGWNSFKNKAHRTASNLRVQYPTVTIKLPFSSFYEQLAENPSLFHQSSQIQLFALEIEADGEQLGGQVQNGSNWLAGCDIHEKNEHVITYAKEKIPAT